ncbi:cytochrome c [Acuticoccus sp. M5D2P5]|uniref:c-type cytochrome n=1 Tax=Acuticoccus kalidii TaxID=2910977 RepID=UPI001F391DE3|nr:c-type cytochrome [Acuticoccus kalidii]MCF3932147.1 cytochrome c [Acuticoccus kalidii]
MTRLLIVLFGLVSSAAMADEALVARGDYLVNTVMACGNCHTPVGPTGPMMDRALSGGLRFDMPAFDVYAANITPAEKTGIGSWSDEEIATAIVDGIRPNGIKLAAVMPTAFYKVLSERDLDAIVAYLRSVPAVENEVPMPHYKMALDEPAFPGAETPIDEAARAGDLVKEGFYLATIAHCMECHTGWTDGHPDPVNRMGAGGLELPGPWGLSVARNITPHPTRGIGAWSDEEIVTAIRTGTRPDGTKLKPPMAFPYYAHIEDADLAAIVAWLRTIPPLE